MKHYRSHRKLWESGTYGPGKFPMDLGINHMYTGVRGVYMDVRQDIPPTINVGSRKGRIYYDGLHDTCFLCRAVGHRKDSCPQRRKDYNKEKHAASVSYAEIVSGQHSSLVMQETAVVSDEKIEVLQDDISEPSTEAVDAETVEHNDPEKTSREEKEKRRKESIEQLTEVAKAIQEVVTKQQASQWRAQFAATGSNKHSRPKKLCARKTFY